MIRQRGLSENADSRLGEIGDGIPRRRIGYHALLVLVFGLASTAVAVLAAPGDVISLERPLLKATDSTFVGAIRCQACHQREYDHWQRTTHATTYDRVTGQSHRDSQTECNRCHTTGAGFESGFESIEKTPQLVGVQCESCHGPGKKHLDSLERSGTDPAYRCESCDVKRNCLPCHTVSRSPGFNLQSALEKVKHPR